MCPVDSTKCSVFHRRNGAITSHTSRPSATTTIPISHCVCEVKPESVQLRDQAIMADAPPMIRIRKMIGQTSTFALGFLRSTTRSPRWSKLSG